VNTFFASSAAFLPLAKAAVILSPKATKSDVAALTAKRTPVGPDSVPTNAWRAALLLPVYPAGS